MNNERILRIVCVLLVISASCFQAVPAWAIQAAATKGAAKVQKQDTGQAIDVEAFIRNKASNIKARNINSHAGYQATRSTFLSSQKSKVDAGNAATQAKINSLKTNAERFTKIRAEAIDMNARYAAASSSDKAKMDKRADDLIAELNRLGY